jgi:hypothetical protein
MTLRPGICGVLCLCLRESLSSANIHLGPWSNQRHPPPVFCAWGTMPDGRNTVTVGSGQGVGFLVQTAPPTSLSPVKFLSVY